MTLVALATLVLIIGQEIESTAGLKISIDFSIGTQLEPKTQNPATDAPHNGCKWESWTEWSECTEICGGGTQERTREPSQESMHGDLPCSGGSSQTRWCDCNCKNTVLYLEESNLHTEIIKKEDAESCKNFCKTHSEHPETKDKASYYAFVDESFVDHNNRKDYHNSCWCKNDKTVNATKKPRQGVTTGKIHCETEMADLDNYDITPIRREDIIGDIVEFDIRTMAEMALAWKKSQDSPSNSAYMQDSTSHIAYMQCDPPLYFCWDMGNGNKGCVTISEQGCGHA